MKGRLTNEDNIGHYVMHDSFLYDAYHITLRCVTLWTPIKLVGIILDDRSLQNTPQYNHEMTTPQIHNIKIQYYR